MTIAQLPLAEHAELRRELNLGEASHTLDRVPGQPIDPQLQPVRAAVAVERGEGDAVIDREDPRSLLGLRDQEIALVRVTVLDQVGEYVELADVPCIHGVGVELVHVKNVGRVRNVLQPVLHDTEHLVRALEGRFHGGGVMVITLELRNRNHAQRRGRHDVFVRVHQQLLDRVRGEVVTRHVVRSEEHTSELQSQSNLVCRLLLEKKKKKKKKIKNIL